MDNVKMGFVLTILAGLSTMIGTLFVFKKKNDRNITIALSFAAGVMLTLSIVDLIPESYSMLKSIFPTFPSIVYVLIFIVSGILFSIAIEKYVYKIENSSNNLYKVGIISMLAIIMHNIPEGIATFMATNKDMMLGLSLAIVIALHNIPEGISISMPIYYSTNNKIKALLFTFLSGVSEPFGALLTYLFLSNFINNRIMGFLFGIIAGIMIYISLYELLPTAKKYGKSKILILSFIFGVVLMIINHYVI